ncbi:methyl-accepting chemotaxis protein [Cytobacillus spongiae]|uniref:methyl-accepting chemotaxis protein n=1 Tax=Cytobacillus spongiae TaxID=2901381 RepID=UPI001F2E04D2|nr:methyl-accepting chemotaxis protein [Cytobacillus spongiae]UII56752.1 methyl-accepting chemotaxis protein [Cytobacillus spongiae]
MKKSLLAQLLTLFLSILLLAGSTIAFFTYNRSVDLTVEQSTQNSREIVSRIDDMLNLFTEDLEKTINLLANQTEVLQYKKEDGSLEIETLFSKYHHSNEALLNSYLATTNKDFVLYPKSGLPEDYDPTKKEWFSKAVNAEGQIVWQEPYTDAATGKTVISALKAVRANGQLIGVVGIDVDVDQFFELVKDGKIGDTGITSIFDNSGKILTHADPKMVGKDISKENFYKEMKKQGKKGTVHYTYNKVEKIMVFTTNEKMGWNVVGTVPKEEFINKSKVLIFPIVVSLIIVSLIATLITYLYVKRTVRPLKELRSAMQEMENGNLTISLSNKRIDEIGQVADSFLKMVIVMKSLIQQVQNTSMRVSESAHTLATSSEENTAAANEVAITMGQIASGVGEQSELIEQNTRSFQFFAEKIDLIETESLKILKESKQMTDVSQSGLAHVSHLEQQSDRSLQLNDDMVKVVSKLNDRSAEISSIVQVISDIAGQTNLLALNAAIEAARASEHGKGFAVVADEVKKLAHQTEDALEEISRIIGKMQAETGDSVKMMEQANKAILEQTKAVNETESAFHVIHDAIGKNNSLIEGIVASIHDIASQQEGMLQNMEQITSISQETAAGTEEISASIEEQTSSMEQLNHMADDMQQSANSMLHEVKKFTI